MSTAITGRPGGDVVAHALVARGREPEGFHKMVAVSLVVHLVGLVGLVLTPASWRTAAVPEETVAMVISLGGAPGPRSGGMTPMGGRPVQQARTEEPARPEPVRPPAAREPEMVVPTREMRPPRPTPRQPEPTRTAPQESRGRTPTQGPEVRAGSAIAQTGGVGIGFGLSTGGGGTGGEINLGDFCCPEWLNTMLQLIQRNWNPKQQVVGTATVRFTVQRDGSITDVQVARSSGFAVLDLTAQRALLTTRLPPLPAEYPNPQLTINLNFEYQR